MLLIIVTTMVFNVFSQRSPDSFYERDYEYGDYGQRSPYQGGGYKDRHLLDDQTAKPLKVDMSVFDKLDEQLQKYDKYKEFEEFTNQVKERTLIDPSRTVQDELKEIIQWSRNLDTLPIDESGYPMQNMNVPPLGPSPGMNPYWGETEEQNNKKGVFPVPGPNTPGKGIQAMNLALRNLESIDAIDNRSPMEKFPEVMMNLPKSLPMDLLNVPIKPISNIRTTTKIQRLPEKDDYNSPIRWVSLDSNDTRDGLAKVTDPRTRKNQQVLLNGTIFVPVRDYHKERLGMTTHPPVLTTDNKVLLTVARSIDFKTLEESDWLVIESALGGRDASNHCNGNSCHSRCKTPACESVCTGDTCASGCIGGFCNTFCKGPGCLSMCIGENCSAKCEGSSCESRCRGDGCEAGCRTDPCSYVKNGRHVRRGGSWSNQNPQYGDKNIGNTYRF